MRRQHHPGTIPHRLPVRVDPGDDLAAVFLRYRLELLLDTLPGFPGSLLLEPFGDGGGQGQVAVVVLCFVLFGTHEETYLALYAGLATWASGWIARRTRIRLPVVFPVVWMAVEVLRASGELGFPWFQPGYTQHAYAPVIQMASLGGATLVTFWLLPSLNKAVAV